MLDLFEALFVEGSPSGIKAALHILGWCENVLRFPLVPVSQKTYHKMEEIIKELKPLQR
jgi:4-hydroxy-tetrahydrodipicolinate synthase